MTSSSKRHSLLDLPDGQSLIVEDTDDGSTYKTHTASIKFFDIRIERMRNQEMLCDITLEADNIKVPAHKLILAASSIYFYTLFSTIAGYSKDRIVLDGVHYEALIAIINYFYTSELHVTDGNVRHLLRASKLLMLTDVYKACCHFMLGQLTLYNCLSIADFAREHNCPEVMASADAFIEKHFLKLTDSNEILDAPHQRLSQIIKSDHLNVSSETDVFKFVMTWIKHDIDNRLAYLASLMEFVRFPLMSVKDLIANVKEESLFQDNGPCHGFYMEALTYHAVKGDSELFFSMPRPKPRQKKYMIVVGICNGKLSMEKYDFMRQVWLQGPQSFERTCSESTCSVIANNKVYMIGGSGRDNKVDMFDFETDKWSECSNLMQGRLYSAAAVLDNNIYVRGGQYLNSCEMFDQNTGQWTKRNDMLDARKYHGMCAMEGKIYVVGGYSGKYLATAECYCQETNTWTYLPNISTSRCDHGVTALDGKLYIMGGINGKTSMKSAEVFDTVKGSWTKIADMNVWRRCFGVAVGNGLIYAAGGFDGNKSLNSVEVYDPMCDTWTMLPQEMITGKQFTCVATMNLNS